MPPESEVPLESEVVAPLTKVDICVEVICREFNVTLPELASGDKSERIRNPRRILMLALSEETMLSSDKIGELLGGRGAAGIEKNINRLRQERKREDLEYVELNEQIEDTIRTIQVCIAELLDGDGEKVPTITREIPMGEIVDECAGEFKVPARELYKGDRPRSKKALYAAVYIADEVTDLSHESIGKLIERSQQAVMDLLDQSREELALDPDFAERVEGMIHDFESEE